jgi:hypothetical protein
MIILGGCAQSDWRTTEVSLFRLDAWVADDCKDTASGESAADFFEVRRVDFEGKSEVLQKSVQYRFYWCDRNLDCNEWVPHLSLWMTGGDQNLVSWSRGEECVRLEYKIYGEYLKIDSRSFDATQGELYSDCREFEKNWVEASQCTSRRWVGGKLVETRKID